MWSLAAGAVMSSLLVIGLAHAQDKFAGATWKYEMTPVSGKGEPMKGVYRVEDGKLYQPREGRPTIVGTLEGKLEYTRENPPNQGDNRKVTLDDLSGNNQTAHIKAKGTIVNQRFGEVTGRFIDSTGAHWDFKASRVQE